MKTKLPESFSSEVEISAFIEELYKNDELYHLDDDAHDIINIETNERVFTDDEADALNKLFDQAFDICDIWQLKIVCQIVDEMSEKLNE